MGTQNKAHKQTAWKKNREFGDKMGGRERLKLGSTTLHGITTFQFLRMKSKRRSPLDKDFRWYSPFANVVETKEGWYAVFTEASAKDFYLNRLIPFGVEGLQNI